jgi:hypothetical protein
MTLSRTGAVYWELANTAQALARHRQALVLLERLTAATPADMQMRHALADSLATIGAGYAELQQQGKMADGCREARPFLARGLSLFRNLEQRGLARGDSATIARLETDLSRCGPAG